MVNVSAVFKLQRRGVSSFLYLAMCLLFVNEEHGEIESYLLMKNSARYKKDSYRVSDSRESLETSVRDSESRPGPLEGE